jgi:hypothetical protein
MRIISVCVSEICICLLRRQCVMSVVGPIHGRDNLDCWLGTGLAVVGHSISGMMAGAGSGQVWR